MILLILSVSLLFVLTVAVVVLCRYAGLRAWQAAVCILLGFYLADSSLAPAIADASRALLDVLTGT